MPSSRYPLRSNSHAVPDDPHPVVADGIHSSQNRYVPGAFDDADESVADVAGQRPHDTPQPASSHAETQPAPRTSSLAETQPAFTAENEPEDSVPRQGDSRSAVRNVTFDTPGVEQHSSSESQASSDPDDMYFDGVSNNTSRVLPTTPESQPSFLATRRRGAYVEEIEDPEAPRLALSKEQATLVNRARQSLTDEQRELIERRQRAVQQQASRAAEASTSRAKGKGVDPRNWGNLDLPEIETEPGTQEQILADIQARHRENDQIHSTPQVPVRGNSDTTTRYTGSGDLEARQKELRDLEDAIAKRKAELARMTKNISGSDTRVRDLRSVSVPMSENLSDLIETTTARGNSKSAKKRKSSKKKKNKRASKDREDPLQPITQITENSALGRAFERIRSESDSDPSDSSSSSSSSSSDSDPGSSSSDSDSETDSSSSTPSSDSRRSRSRSGSRGRRHRRDRKSRKKAQKKKKSKSKKTSSRSIIKPTPPEKYSGNADLQAFLKFLTHGTSYVKYGRVEKERQVLVLSEFLVGKAYTFYIREVSMNPEDWTAERFFKELFNYCFPLDYRNKQRRRLERCEQGNRSVKDYVAELNELFTIVGSYDEKARVVKLFNNFRPSIQKELYRSKLNPEVSRWTSIVQEAEYAEMAEAVEAHPNSYHRDRDRSHQTSGGGGNGSSRRSHNTNGQSRGSGSGSSRPRSPYGRKTNTTPNSSSGNGNTKGFTSNKFKPGDSKARRQNDSSAKKNQLSKKEEEELRAANKCFRCREVGHMARNCPQNNKTTTNTGKPPGMSSYSIRVGVDLEDTERLREASIADTTEGLSLGMISWADVEAHSISSPAEFFGLSSDESSDDFIVPSPPSDPGSLRARSFFSEHASDFITYMDDIVPPLALSSDRGDEDDADRMTYGSMPSLRTVTPTDPSVGGESEPRIPTGSSSASSKDGDLPIPVEDDCGNSETSTLISITNVDIGKEEPSLLDDIPLELPKPFGEYSRKVPHPEVKIYLLDRDLRKNGPPASLGDAAVNKLEYMLESMQPYPADPVNVLQFKGKRFIAHHDRDDPFSLVVFDFVCMDAAVISIDAVENPNFQIGLWYSRIRSEKTGVAVECDDHYCTRLVAEVHAWNAKRILEVGIPWVSNQPNFRFRVIPEGLDRNGDVSFYKICDRALDFNLRIEGQHLRNASFNLVGWYQKRLFASYACLEQAFSADDDEILSERFFTDLKDLHPEDSADNEYLTDLWCMFISAMNRNRIRVRESGDKLTVIELNGQQVERGTYPALQRTAAYPKDPARVVPKPIVIVVKINGHPCRALVDSGSLGDFMSSTIAEQLQVKKKELKAPLPVQLAAQGSRTKINFLGTAQFEYQRISEERIFDIINLSGYDLILGTPWLFQHRVTCGLNPSRIVIGSDKALPLEGEACARMSSRVMLMYEDNLEKIREYLRDYALPLCKSASETPLPPLRAINHEIPLIDPNLVYPWRPSRCPEPLRQQWSEKKEAYLKCGRWKVTSSGNTVPMLLIRKPGKEGEPPQLRTVVDLRARNANTLKKTSPLPDIDGILRRAARAKYRTILDGKDAYEQIRIIPEHVDRTAVTTPDGNMISQVIQIGDCNGPATYQALMNHIFSPFIGVFMDVYLDDLIIYSETLEEHVEHVTKVLDVLKREKLYLSAKKMHFVCKDMKVLGRVIDDEGIRMDPDKVDSLAKWKTPTNRDLLRGFLGAAGYLADDIDRVRIPMGVLHTLTSDNVPFRWEYTHQRAFEDIKRLATTCRDHHRKPLDYGAGAPPINVVTDGCGTGVAGVISQGEDWRNAKVAAFYSAKLNPAQQNYPVHEIEMLAGVETMLRYRDILQGVKFKWYTDHKGLVHLLNQKNLSGRQARWLEKISEFDFEVVYVPGVENILSDALSRLYAYDEPGTVRARAEYTYHDVMDNDSLASYLISMPLLVGSEGESASLFDESVLDAEGVSPEVVDVVVRPADNAQVSVPDDRRRKRAQTQVPPAETGRPETGAEFAARMSRNFVLRGPRERKEGESGTEKLFIRIPARKPNAKSDKPENREQSHDRELAENAQKLANLVNSTAHPAPREYTPEEAPSNIDVSATIRGKYRSDPFFAKIVEKPRDFKNFEVTNDGLVYLKLNDRKVLCIPSIKTGTRSLREIIISDAHTLLAHLGGRKTLSYLRDIVWWKDLVRDVHSFCDSCITCKRTKPSNQKPYGLLNPLPVPVNPWDVMGFDFVGPLPLSKNRDGTFDSIAVFIDHLTSMVHLVPCRTDYTASQIAELVFEHVYKLHGLPKAIVSDRDSLFTSLFWTRLHELIGTKLKMSSAYHPETDGATERANKTITQMIRQCIHPNQRDWVSKLPAVEFAINSSRSDSTGYAPFFLNNGRMPRSMVWDSSKDSEYPGVRVFAQRLKSAIMAAHDSVLTSRVKQVRMANRKRQVAPFKEQDLVYISTKNLTFPKGLARKLVPKFVGPYEIVKDFGNNSYRIKLPNSMKQRGIHDVFHSSLLRIHVPNDDRLFPGRLDNQIIESEDRETEWAADKILSHSGSRTSAIFEVLWKSGDKTWIPYDQLLNMDLLDPYLQALGVDNIADLPAGSGIPPSDDPQIFLGSILPNLLDPFNPTRSSAFAFLQPLLDVSSGSSSSLSKGKSSTNNHRRRNSGGIMPGPRNSNNNRSSGSRGRSHHRHPPKLVSFSTLHQDPETHLVTLKVPGEPVIIIHPLQLKLYYRYEMAVRSGRDREFDEPAGYEEFCGVFNRDNSHSYRWCTWDTDQGGYIPNGEPPPLHALPLSFVDPDHRDLRGLGVLTNAGLVDPHMLNVVQQAILRPHKEAARNDHFHKIRLDEAAHQDPDLKGKKRKLDPKDYKKVIRPMGYRSPSRSPARSPYHSDYEDQAAGPSLSSRIGGRESPMSDSARM